MFEVDLGKLETRMYVTEVNETVGIWEFRLEGLDEKLKIKVRRYNRSDLPYMGVANLYIKNSEQADFYISLHFRATIEDAIEEALSGFSMFYKVDDPGLKVKPYHNW